MELLSWFPCAVSFPANEESWPKLATQVVVGAPDALPTAHFSTKLYTGDGATTLAVSGVGFSPGMTWIKNRSAADDHTLVDSVRGATKYLVSNDTDIEVDDSTFVASLDSDGFTVGDDVVVNTSTENYVSWNWKTGTTFDPKTAGDITVASGSKNVTAGFSIVKYTGESATPTIGHGLSQAPEMIIIKNLVDSVPLQDWAVFATSMDESHGMELNTTIARATFGDWDDTFPTSSVFKLGDGYSRVNQSGSDMVAYCFHSVEGYSKVGTVTGTAGSLFVYMGFKPAFVMWKSSNSAQNWNIYDNKRPEFNPSYHLLEPNTTDVESGDWTTNRVDIVSNGFNILSTGLNQLNGGSGYNYIYLAFAESPFKYSNAR